MRYLCSKLPFYNAEPDVRDTRITDVLHALLGHERCNDGGVGLLRPVRIGVRVRRLDVPRETERNEPFVEDLNQSLRIPRTKESFVDAGTYKSVVEAEAEVGQEEVEIDLLVHPWPIGHFPIEISLPEWIQMPPS